MAKDKKQLFDAPAESTGPVECLGMTFESDEARRAYFTEKLREKLQDPEFRKIEGFPIGEDEDILALSDPPYYTACPNPFLGEFVASYATPYDAASDDYDRLPFSADVREGKNDPIYNAHSYHTKVPHKAIMRYILHYTNPGDIVFDGFCGTGMTGVAAQLCGNRAEVESLGYRVSKDGKITDENGQGVSALGPRPAVLSDLAPIATFIARNLVSPIRQSEFVEESRRILKESKDRLPHIYAVTHPETKRTGQLIYGVWSDFLLCSECGAEINAWDVVVDHENDKMHGEFACPQCSAELKRRSLDKVLETTIDPILGTTVRQTKQSLQILHFKIGRDRFQKIADQNDNAVLEAAQRMLSEFTVPTASFEHTWRHLRDGNHLRGITHSHHYYTARNLLAMSCLLEACHTSKYPLDMLFVFTGFLEGHANRRNRYIVDRHHPEGTTCGPLSNTLFVPEVQCEVNIFNCWEKTLKKQAKAKAVSIPRHCFVQVRSASASGLQDNSVDYIFVDPPFGKNIMYSDLNLLYEAWLRVQTAVSEEAIVNDRQEKGLAEYGDLMSECFTEFYRILKPGRWLTLEFHNSLNAVWSRIQEALAKAGFVVADVRVLDKKHGTLHQDSGYTVKQDLIVSAYKPTADLEERFRVASGSESSAWEFVNAHLQQLPVFVGSNGRAEVVKERQSYLLFDRMVAFHVERNVVPPMSAPEFHAGLAERFDERNGMFFLPEQAVEYDRKRARVKEVVQLELFVSNEASAIQWLKQQLLKKPQTIPEIQPAYLQEIGGWQKYEKPMELRDLLEQNFLCYEGDDEVPSQIHSYLSSNFHELRNLNKDDSRLKEKAKNRWYVPDPRKEADLEKIRHKSLMREFDEYLRTKGKLAKVRTEALKAGFQECYRKQDYGTIVSIGRRVKESVIQDDMGLLLYYDNAVMLSNG